MTTSSSIASNMTIQELRTKTKDELKDTLNKKLKELGDVSLNVLQGKEKNVKKTYFVRKEIARIKTLLNEKRSTENA